MLSHKHWAGAEPADVPQPQLPVRRLSEGFQGGDSVELKLAFLLIHDEATI